MHAKIVDDRATQLTPPAPANKTSARQMLVPVASTLSLIIITFSSDPHEYAACGVRRKGNIGEQKAPSNTAVSVSRGFR